MTWVTARQWYLDVIDVFAEAEAEVEAEMVISMCEEAEATEKMEGWILISMSA